MTRSIIETWLVRLNGHEGGYANRSPEADPGGETKWGISKKSYPHLNIKSLTLNDAALIYEKDFIAPLTKHQLRPSTTFQLLDFAVHSGMTQAVKILQKELKVYVDGRIGPETRDAVLNTSESDLSQLIIAGRLDFLTTLANWSENSRGWARRMAGNLRYGVEDTD